MTIKIIDIGPDASVVKKIICKHCGATLEYCPIDVVSVEIKSDSDLDVTSWINCPNCGKMIRVENV
jgi:RNase P subunit RPR2